MEPGEIQLWSAGLDIEASALRALRETLSPDELERADRFLRQADRRRFTAARGLLRRLLAGYRDSQPRQLRFAYGEKGKPSLVDGAGLSFSLSHCQGRGLFAFAWNRELGVDLEIPREGLDVQGLAARFFSPGEAARIAALSGVEREGEFYRLWTAKEAYAKALGLGLAAIRREPDADPRFRVEEIRLGADEFAALAYSGEKTEVRLGTVDCVTA